MTRVKLCGTTRLEDAELAVELGAWAIGFILWPQSKRHVDPGVAAGIARTLRRRIELVGVFVNQPLDEVEAAAEAIGLTHVQLHGDEGPSFCVAAHERTGARVIKALRIASAADLRNAARYHTDYHLLDSAVRGHRGGSGQAWDWELAAQRRSDVPVILSGGLTPENVGDGIAAVRPFAVDVASGVEASPGIKDPAKMEAFVRAAQGRGVAGDERSEAVV
jgi:phosphoribosylanthranilate isomerase